MMNLTQSQIAQSLAGISLIERLATSEEKLEDNGTGFDSYNRFSLVVLSLDKLLYMSEEQFLLWLTNKSGLDSLSFYLYAEWIERVYNAQIDEELGYPENIDQQGQALIHQARATLLQLGEYLNGIGQMENEKMKRVVKSVITKQN